MQRSAAELHRMLLDTAREAAANIQTNIERKTAEYQRFEAFMPINPAVSVLTFEKLWNKAQEKPGSPRRNASSTLHLRTGELGDRDFSTKIVSELASLCKEDAPMIVLFYSPPFYPAVSSKDDPLIRKVMREVKQYAADRHGIEFTEVQYFPGLSDLSYLQLQNSQSMRSHPICRFFITAIHFQKDAKTHCLCRSSISGRPAKILTNGRNVSMCRFHLESCQISSGSRYTSFSKIRDRLKKNRERAKTLFPTF